MNYRKNIFLAAIFASLAFVSAPATANGFLGGLVEHALSESFKKLTDDKKPVLTVKNNASQTYCKLNYLDGSEPNILDNNLAKSTQPVCYPSYSTLFSGVTRTPLWSGNHLTPDRVAGACSISRHDLFHPDENLPAGMRSELSDYLRSGLDKGHLVPSADNWDASAQADSFSLANIVPQSGDSGVWQRLENGARNLVISGHDVYIVSGPLFEDSSYTLLHNRVRIPSGLFKAIYDVTTQQSAVYVVSNNADQSFNVISVNDLTSRAGIDVFPSVPPELKSQVAFLLSPGKRTNCGGIKKVS